MAIDWQARASQLVNLIDPAASFKAGEFENITDDEWVGMMAELRTKAMTEAKLAEIELRKIAKETARIGGLAKLTPEERDALNL